MADKMAATKAALVDPIQEALGFQEHIGAWW